MPLTVAELRATYSVDEGPLDKSLQGMGGKVQSTFGKVAAAAAGAFAFSKLSDGFFSLTGAASDLQGTISKSTAIFGGNAGAIDQWAKAAATNLGLSRQQALASAAGFGDMFSQIGFAGDQATDMSKAVVQMSADLGAFNDLETSDVADRISAAFRGEYDSLQALIPNINAARVEQEAMAATGKTNAAELTAQEKAAAVLAIVNKDGARAVGAFAKESDSAAGSAKIATAQWEEQKAAIGERLLPAFTTLMGFLSGTVIPGVGKLAGFIADDVVPALQDMAKWVSDNKTPILIIAGIIAAVFIPHLIALGVESTKSGAKQAAAWLLAKGEAIKGAAAHSLQVLKVVGGWVLMGAQAVLHGAKQAAVWTAQVVKSAVTGAVSFGVQVAKVVGGWVLMGVQSLLAAAKMAAAWFIALGPVGWVIAAVIGLVALIVANWDTVVSWTTTAWSAVTGAISAAWEWIKGAVSAGIDFLVDLFLNFTGPGLIIKHWDDIVAATQAAWQWIQDAIGVAVQWVLDAIGWLGQLPGKVAGWFGGVKDAALGKLGELVSWLGGLPGQILSAIGNLGSTLLTAGGDLLRGLWDGISGSVSWLKNKIMDWAGNLLPGWVKDILGINSPSTVFAEMGGYLMLGMADGIDAEAKTAVTAAARAAAAITDAMQVQAPDLMGLANQQASAALAVRRPAGMLTGATAGGAAGQAGTTGGSTGPLVNIEEYHEQPGSSPAATAAALAVEVRTRPWG